MADSGPVILIEDMSRTYSAGDTAVHALRHVDLRVEAGEMLAIMGASGSGKSTLMNLLGCLDRPSGGRYWLDGVRVDELNRRQLADIRNTRIGFVFQGFNLLSRTSALDNVELPLLYDRRGRKVDRLATARAALERVGLGDRLHHEPSELSGGQQQRVAIARALVHEPEIIVCDEPTSALDGATGEQILIQLDEMTRRSKKSTVVLVTHDSRIFHFADRIAEMEDGHIVKERIPDPHAGHGTH